MTLDHGYIIFRLQTACAVHSFLGGFVAVYSAAEIALLSLYKPLLLLTLRLSASALGKGQPEVRLSAPVRREMRAFSPPNSRHHVPNAASAALPTNPSRNPVCPVSVCLDQQ